MLRYVMLVPTLLLTTVAASAQQLPTEIGQCVKTTISEITTRVGSGTGDVVGYPGDLYGVSYDTVDGLKGSRVGDPVKLCLVSVPQDCPPGDERGKVYSAYNPRTGLSWELPDAGHMCGGA